MWIAGSLEKPRSLSIVCSWLAQRWWYNSMAEGSGLMRSLNFLLWKTDLSGSVFGHFIVCKVYYIKVCAPVWPLLNPHLRIDKGLSKCLWLSLDENAGSETLITTEQLSTQAPKSGTDIRSVTTRQIKDTWLWADFVEDTGLATEIVVQWIDFAKCTSYLSATWSNSSDIRFS